MNKLIGGTLLFIAIGLGGCAALHKPATHPGAISDFDSYAADVLYGAQTALCSIYDTQAGRCTEGLSAHVQDYPAALPAIQSATRDYNVAFRAYSLYHQGAKGATQQQVSEAIATLIHSIAAARRAQGGKK